MEKRDKIATRLCNLIVLWKDGSTDWIQLKYIKDSNPVEFSEYTVVNLIQDQPAFFLVGLQGTDALEYNHIQGEVQLLQDDTTVRDTIAQY